MADWIAKLDDLLRLSDRAVLTHAGSVSSEQALEHGKAQFARFKRHQLNQSSPVERDFDAATRDLKQIEQARKQPVRGTKPGPGRKKR